MKFAPLFGCWLALAGCGTHPDSASSGRTSPATPANGAQPSCGNGILEVGEQCDDANLTNLDGCDSTCRFEEAQRITSLQAEWDPTNVCPTNAFGAAVQSIVRVAFQKNLDDKIKSGQMSVVLSFNGLADATGPSGSSFSLGAIVGAPATGGGYDGTRDLDWWYEASSTTIDDSRRPLTSVMAKIEDRVLSAGPGTMAIDLALGSNVSRVALSNVHLEATVGDATAPLEASMDAPPGHFVKEHLDSSLRSFSSLLSGQLCAGLSADSLAHAAIPDALLSGLARCSEGYTSANSMLDLLVSGCTLFAGTAIRAAQPDVADSAAKPAGAGGPYQLSADAHHVVTECADHQGQKVPLEDCFNSAAYSSAFQFATDRVILH